MPQPKKSTVAAKIPDAQPLETIEYKLDPKLLKAPSKNARYMNEVQLQRLVDNLKRDRILTSAILVYREGEDLIVLSGEHRRQAALVAELPVVPVIEIKTLLTQERKVAIQLSHNAIAGQDDLGILSELYSSLPLDEKLYSGLTDDSFDIEELDLDALKIGSPSYEEISFLFLPQEAEALKGAISEIESRKKLPEFIGANMGDYERWFEAVVTIKKKLKITNNAIAIRAMADLAMKQLEEDDGK